MLSNTTFQNPILIKHELELKGKVEEVIEVMNIRQHQGSFLRSLVFIKKVAIFEIYIKFCAKAFWWSQPLSKLY